MSQRCRPGCGSAAASAAGRQGRAVLDRTQGWSRPSSRSALPALVLAGLLAPSVSQVASAQLRCLDAAGIAARLAARGELAADVDAGARAAAPHEAPRQLFPPGGGRRRPS